MTHCNTCNKEYSPDCDYRQGRCPGHMPMINPHAFRFYNLFQAIKSWFRK